MKRTLRAIAAVSFLSVTGVTVVATRTHAQTLTTGTISGTVTDASGKKLSGVQITVVDTGQTDITNANGYFVITDILPGTHTVQASLVGFEPVSATGVTVTQELVTGVTLQLQARSVTSTGTTNITVRPLIHKDVTPTLYTVTSKEEQLVRSEPNNLYQYPGALISQPGVIPDADGYPSIRGSKTDEINYMVDGISVVKTSNNGFGSNLVTVGLDRLNLYTGGYGAQLGNAIGGVVNAVIKTGASMRGKAGLELNVGSSEYEGVLYEQGNVEKNGFNWYVSGNFFRTHFDKNTQIDDLTASADVIAKIIQPLGKKDRLTFLHNQGTEHYTFPINDPLNPAGQLGWGGDPTAVNAHTLRYDSKTNSIITTPYTQDYAPQGYNIESLTYNHQFTPASNLSGQYYYFNSHDTYNGLSPFTNLDQTRHDQQNTGRLDYSNQLSQSLQFRVGGEYIHSDNYNETLQLVELGTGNLFAPDESVFTVYHRIRPQDAQDMNAYVSLTAKPSNRLTIDLGGRYDSRKYHRQITAADLTGNRASTDAADLAVLLKTGENPKLSKTTPRIGATFQLSQNTLVKGSAGQFVLMPGSNYIERQFVATPAGITLPSGDVDVQNYYGLYSRKVFDLKPQIADSYDVGIEHQFNRTLGLAITPYYRRVQNEVVTASVVTGYKPDGTPIYLAGGTANQSTGHGHVRGIESKLELRQTHGLSGWITYTLQSAKDNNSSSLTASNQNLLPFALRDQEHRLDYDQKHTIYVVGQYQRGNFEINPELELGSGYPYGSGDPDDEGQYTFNGLPIIEGGRLATRGINGYNTGWHKNLSVTFRLYSNKQKSNYYFLQVYNIINSHDVTAKGIEDPATGAPIGFVPGPVTYTDANGNQVTSADGAYTYKPTTIVKPTFVLLGLRQEF